MAMVGIPSSQYPLILSCRQQGLTEFTTTERWVYFKGPMIVLDTKLWRRVKGGRPDGWKKLPYDGELLMHGTEITIVTPPDKDYLYRLPKPIADEAHLWCARLGVAMGRFLIQATWTYCAMLRKDIDGRQYPRSVLLEIQADMEAKLKRTRKGQAERMRKIGAGRKTDKERKIAQQKGGEQNEGEGRIILEAGPEE